MAIDWQPLVDLIRQYQTFLLMTHIRPDADGLGSQLALADAMISLGKTPRVTIASNLPPRYKFLDPDGKRIERFKPPGASFRNVDAVIVLDTGTWGQLADFGDFMKTLNCPKFVVDHHRTQDDLGAVALVDTSAEATGRLVYELIMALGVPLTPSSAHHLFMALALDTGWFRHPNTTAATFELAHCLVAAGANPTPLYENLFEAAPLARLKLVGIALQRMQLRSNGRIGFTEVQMSDYAAVAASPGDTEDLINYPRAIDGVQLAMIFIEQQDGGTKVSFRSRSPVDVSKLAERFNGGGHMLASGARLKEPLALAREIVLAAAEEALAEAFPVPIVSDTIATSGAAETSN